MVMHKQIIHKLSDEFVETKKFSVNYDENFYGIQGFFLKKKKKRKKRNWNVMKSSLGPFIVFKILFSQ